MKKPANLHNIIPALIVTIVQCCLQLSWNDPGMLLCNVGVLKTVQCTIVRQQWLVAGWLSPSVTVRVKVRDRLGLGLGLGIGLGIG